MVLRSIDSLTEWVRDGQANRTMIGPLQFAGFANQSVNMAFMTAGNLPNSLKQDASKNIIPRVGKLSSRSTTFRPQSESGPQRGEKGAIWQKRGEGGGRKKYLRIWPQMVIEGAGERERREN